MIAVGRVCVKIAGRDAGMKCIVTEVIDNNYVRIVGETRSRKCNITHLEPLNQRVDLKGSSETAIKKALADAGINLRVSKPKKTAAQSRAQKKA